MFETRLDVFCPNMSLGSSSKEWVSDRECDGGYVGEETELDCSKDECRRGTEGRENIIGKLAIAS